MNLAAPVALGALLAAACVWGPAGPAGAATKKATKKTAKVSIAAGKPCPTLDQSAPGTGLDCVLVGKALQWQPRGTKVNPFRVGDVGAFATKARVINYQVKVTGPPKMLDATAIAAPDPNRAAIPAGSAPFQFPAEINNLGPDVGDPPAALTDFTLVDRAGVAYALYSGAECATYTTSAGALAAIEGAIHLRNIAVGVNTGAFCAVLPTTTVDAKLYLRIKVLDGADLWFRTV